MGVPKRCRRSAAMSAGDSERSSGPFRVLWRKRRSARNIGDPRPSGTNLSMGGVGITPFLRRFSSRRHDLAPRPEPDGGKLLAALLSESLLSAGGPRRAGRLPQAWALHDPNPQHQDPAIPLQAVPQDDVISNLRRDLQTQKAGPGGGHPPGSRPGILAPAGGQDSGNQSKDGLPTPEEGA